MLTWQYVESSSFHSQILHLIKYSTPVQSLNDLLQPRCVDFDPGPRSLHQELLGRIQATAHLESVRPRPGEVIIM